VDARGFATFSALDRNHAFRPFSGESPQSLFNCVGASQRPPENSLPTFARCTLRVSSNNAAATSDQAFAAIELTVARSPSAPLAGGTPRQSHTKAGAKSSGARPTVRDRAAVRPAAIAVASSSPCRTSCGGVATMPATPTAPSATVTPVATTPTLAAPAGTPTPDPAVLLKDGGIAIIEAAYGRLLDEYIEPLDSSRILDGAWTLLAQEANAESLPLPAKPAFDDDRTNDFAAFRSAYARLTAGVADPTQLRYAAIRGMATTLQDCHTFFLNPVANDTLVDTRAGKGSVGVGVELAGIPPLVTEVIAGGPASGAGVLVGAIGYVRIRNFIDGGVAQPLRTALTVFDAQGVRSWIIDLRGDPGGRLDPDAISLFVKDGVIVRDRGRGGVLEEERASGATLPVVRPTVLLTNNRTGSVAEVFAAALQEYHQAYVIGANTNGCVGYTDIQPLGDGSSLAVTTNTHLGPVTNNKLNGVGVAPDEPVARTQNDIANARDPQLDAAIAHLRAAAPGG